MRELPNIHINPSYVTAKGVKGQVRFEATSDEARLLLNQDIEKWDPQAVTSDTLRTFIVKGEIKIIRTGSDVTKSMPKSSISSNPAPARTSNPSIPTPTTVSPPNSSQLPPRSTQSEPQKHQPNPAIFMINNDLPLDEWERAMQALLKDRQKRLDERRKESEREGKILKNFAVVIERVSRR